ncbi:hypothetical protein [Nocardia lasii]|uniref:Uncharacterized protein n=1 Tax=Nocardia lasii TaxID=1616107 RepID=A0ABW1JQF0_9NOCA
MGQHWGSGDAGSAREYRMVRLCGRIEVVDVLEETTRRLWDAAVGRWHGRGEEIATFPPMRLWRSAVQDGAPAGLMTPTLFARRTAAGDAPYCAGPGARLAAAIMLLTGAPTAAVDRGCALFEVTIATIHGDHGDTALDIARAVYTSAGADPILRDDTVCRWTGTAVPVPARPPAPSSKGPAIAGHSRLEEVR